MSSATNAAAGGGGAFCPTNPIPIARKANAEKMLRELSNQICSADQLLAEVVKNSYESGETWSAIMASI